MKPKADPNREPLVRCVGPLQSVRRAAASRLAMVEWSPAAFLFDLLEMDGLGGVLVVGVEPVSVSRFPLGRVWAASDETENHEHE